MNDPVVAHVVFVDGPVRPVYEDAGGQYTFDNDENRVRGVWFIPREECDRPVMVDAKSGAGLS